MTGEDVMRIAATVAVPAIFGGVVWGLRGAAIGGLIGGGVAALGYVIAAGIYSQLPHSQAPGA